MARPNKTSYRLQEATTQTLTTSGSSQKFTNPVGSYTTVVRLLAKSDCFVRFGGSNVTAAATDVPLQANVPEYFGIHAGAYVAVIQDSAAGKVYLTEISE